MTQHQRPGVSDEHLTPATTEHEFITVLQRRWCVRCPLFQQWRGPTGSFAAPGDCSGVYDEIRNRREQSA